MRAESPSVVNAPPAELSRSPAAARIGALAAASGLGLTHFEYRHHLRPPDGWVPPERPDLFGEPHWQRGRLVEPKYGPFRHDSAMGSFHPGHRGKWTAHELCHALVGHAWRPDATPLFLALGARLAELLPVALYYFLDEAGLRRCARHDGPLYGTFCADCEAAALAGPRPVTGDWFERGRAFVEAELAAARRSIEAGRPIGHRWTTIDLQSDATAYVAAHRLRLMSPTFRRFAERFPAPDRTHATLDALEARVRALLDDLTGGAPAKPLVGDRAQWVAHDLGWRLLVTSTVCDGDVLGEIEGLVDALAARPDAQGVAEVIEGYCALHDDWIIPEPAQVFATGYALPGGFGFDVAQAARGIASVLPGTMELLGEAAGEVVDVFVRGEAPTRGPIARRFARFLTAEAPGPVADLARYEAAVAHADAGQALGDAFGPWAPAADDRIRAADGVELVAVGVDVRGLAAQIEDDPDGLPDDLDDLDARSHVLAVRRTAGGDVVVAEVERRHAEALEVLAKGAATPSAVGLTGDALLSLQSLGFVEPAGWRLSG